MDVVVSNAGYGLFGAAEELEDAEIDRQLATNVVASIQLARAVVPHFRRQGGRPILQLSSLGGQVGFPGMSLHHASKWAIEGFCEAFGPEVAPFGIRTALVEPGMARTRFGGSSAAVAEVDPSYEAVLRVGAVPQEAMPGDPPDPGAGRPARGRPLDRRRRLPVAGGLTHDVVASAGRLSGRRSPRGRRGAAAPRWRDSAR